MMNEKTLILVRGLPGSGKTTLAIALADQFANDGYLNRWPVVCAADDYFYDETEEYRFDPRFLKAAHSECQRVADRGMQRGMMVIVHNTFTQRWEMKPYLDLAEQYGYQVQEIVCKGDFGSVHDVPAEKIEQMRARWED